LYSNSDDDNHSDGDEYNNDDEYNDNDNENKDSNNDRKRDENESINTVDYGNKNYDDIESKDSDLKQKNKIKIPPTLQSKVCNMCINIYICICMYIDIDTYGYICVSTYKSIYVYDILSKDAELK
jgi:hypothetical protein